MSVVIVVAVASIQNVSIGTKEQSSSLFSLFSSFIPLWESAGLQDLFHSPLLMMKYNSSHLFLLWTSCLHPVEVAFNLLIDPNTKKNPSCLLPARCTYIHISIATIHHSVHHNKCLNQICAGSISFWSYHPNKTKRPLKTCLNYSTNILYFLLCTVNMYNTLGIRHYIK